MMKKSKLEATYSSREAEIIVLASTQRKNRPGFNLSIEDRSALAHSSELRSKAKGRPGVAVLRPQVDTLLFVDLKLSDGPTEKG